MQELPELYTQGNCKNLVQRYLPKHADMDKMLKIIQRKVLKGTHLPITMKEISQNIYSVHNSRMFIGI